jgi:hypothetical protein
MNVCASVIFCTSLYCISVNIVFMYVCSVCMKHLLCLFDDRRGVNRQTKRIQQLSDIDVWPSNILWSYRCASYSALAESESVYVYGCPSLESGPIEAIYTVSTYIFAYITNTLKY